MSWNDTRLVVEADTGKLLNAKRISLEEQIEYSKGKVEKLENSANLLNFASTQPSSSLDPAVLQIVEAIRQAI